MKNILITALVAFFGAYSAMTASILGLSYNEEKQLITLQISYCYDSDKPKVELVKKHCQETYPATCFITLSVYGESTSNDDLNTCVAEWINYDVVDKPALLIFRADDGSEKSIRVE